MYKQLLEYFNNRLLNTFLSLVYVLKWFVKEHYIEEVLKAQKSLHIVAYIQSLD